MVLLSWCWFLQDHLYHDRSTSSSFCLQADLSVVKVRNTGSVTSIYTWEGELCIDDEVLLVIKTTGPAFHQLTAVVKDAHPYDVPEIIGLSVTAGSTEYLKWIDDNVTGS